ncbi:hypothetical protein ACLKMH_16305 [Psychromonas sp. KJ10-10]|uniref:hypothetical protein n=1 Tax=Psychromonas sp. KJ10-10 TaxID=3391823 RepID=UPI0039B48D7E
MNLNAVIDCDLIVIIRSELNVMANYKPDLSCQSKFIPIDFAQQIIPGTFEYALSHIVDKHLDLSSFDSFYKNDRCGALLILLLLC